MQDFRLNASDGADVHCYAWPHAEPIGLIQIAHGMGEHAQRYDAVAQALNQAGYAVYANDHRGHGGTGAENLGYMGADGWNRVLADAYEINCRMRADHAEGLPLVLLGHSMGSMMAQQYVTRYGDSIDGLVLSGSPGFNRGLLAHLPRWVARFEAWRIGADQQSEVLQKLLFGRSNDAFQSDTATGFEWLSRDASEVQAYVDDDACGFVLSAGSLCDLFAGAALAQRPDCLQNIPRDLPVYVFSGTEDPVHNERTNIDRLLLAYESVGLKRVKVRWYEGGRHEMFNEINSGEVVSNLVKWLSELK